MPPTPPTNPTPESNPAPAPAPTTAPPAAPPPTPQAGAPMQPIPAGGEDPGKGMGIAALIFAFLAPLIGFILGLIARSKSKKAGHKNGLALAAIIISIISMVVGLLFASMVILLAISRLQECEKLGPGTHVVDGQTITCSSDAGSSSTLTPSTSTSEFGQ